jgi:hypothetical protein
MKYFSGHLQIKHIDKKYRLPHREKPGLSNLNQSPALSTPLVDLIALYSSLGLVLDSKIDQSHGYSIIPIDLRNDIAVA